MCGSGKKCDCKHNGLASQAIEVDHEAIGVGGTHSETPRTLEIWLRLTLIQLTILPLVPGVQVPQIQVQAQIQIGD